MNRSYGTVNIYWGVGAFFSVWKKSMSYLERKQTKHTILSVCWGWKKLKFYDYFSQKKYVLSLFAPVPTPQRILTGRLITYQFIGCYIFMGKELTYTNKKSKGIHAFTRITFSAPVASYGLQVLILFWILAYWELVLIFDIQFKCLW